MSVLSRSKNKLSVKEEVRATLCYLISNICTKAFGFITIPLYKQSGKEGKRYVTNIGHVTFFISSHDHNSNRTFSLCNDLWTH